MVFMSYWFEQVQLPGRSHNRGRGVELTVRDPLGIYWVRMAGVKARRICKLKKHYYIEIGRSLVI